MQDNHSKSVQNVVRGLHYQLKHTQGKLVRVIHGSIYDVAVDIRMQSPTFGKWVGAYLSSDNKHQLWIPKGFAHGFLVLSESAEVLYKTTDYWVPEYESTILWSDQSLNIEWPIHGAPIVSVKDAQGVPFGCAKVFEQHI